MAGQDRPPISSDSLFAGRYELGRVLGRGGAADVFGADDLLLGRHVAVKVFRHSEHAPHDEHRIDAEMRTLASLSYPGLVTLFDAGVTRDSSGVDVRYLVMELVEGPTLAAFRDHRQLPPEAVARIGCELAESLSYIHSAGVIHRDIKPANVLIGDGAIGRTKLADFGIARVVDADRLTAHGSAVGTAHYLSPEQATGAVAGPESDVYSLGLVLIECLTGRMVFEGNSTAAALARLHRDPDVPTELGAGWVSLLKRMTARRPEQRPSAAAVSESLRTLTDAGTSPIGTAILATTPQSAELDEANTVTLAHTASRRGLILGIVGALLVAAAILWGISALPDQAGPPAEATTAPPVPTTSQVPTTTDVPTTTEVPAVGAVSEPAAPVQSVPSVPSVDKGNNGNGNSNGNNGNGGNGNGNGNGTNGNGNNGKGNK